MVRSSSLFKLVTSIGDTLFGLETQISEIEEIFEEFTKTKEGGSAVVFGHRFSGKRSVIDKVIKNYQNLIEIKRIDGLLFSTDAMASRFFDADQVEMPRMIILFDFDQFVIRQNQLFLYKILNATRHYPVFALCVTTRLDYMDLLENRVRSRLLNKVILFSKMSTKLSDFCNVFRCFLLAGGNNTDVLVKSFTQIPKIKELIKYIYHDKGCSFALLKQIFTVFYTFMEVEDVHTLTDERCADLFIEASRTLAPTEDPMKNIFESLTLRQLCLLVSCMHISRSRRRTEITYCEITSAYKLFVKLNLPPLYIVDNNVLYKELDALSSLGLLEVSQCSGQQSFKKTSLQISADDVESYLDDYPSLPTGFKKWIAEFD